MRKLIAAAAVVWAGLLFTTGCHVQPRVASPPDPSYSAQEQALLDQLMVKCNDMANEPTIHVRAEKTLEVIQNDGGALGPNETPVTVEKFVRDSIPDSVGPQKCVDLMVIYARMRSTGAITAP